MGQSLSSLNQRLIPQQASTAMSPPQKRDPIIDRSNQVLSTVRIVVSAGPKPHFRSGRLFHLWIPRLTRAAARIFGPFQLPRSLHSQPYGSWIFSYHYCRSGYGRLDSHLQLCRTVGCGLPHISLSYFTDFLPPPSPTLWFIGPFPLEYILPAATSWTANETPPQHTESPIHVRNAFPGVY